MVWGGVHVYKSGERIVFEARLLNDVGGIVTGGTTSLYLYELQNDGTLRSYDWSSNTFKTTALTTETQALTHRTGNNGTRNTAVWTAALATVTGFTVGAQYLAIVENSNAYPTTLHYRFQYGGTVGDILQPVVNQAWTNFPFMMFDTDGSPATGKTVTCTRSLDGGAFGAGALANVAEIANGWYRVDFGAADRNGKVVLLRATAAGCRDTNLELVVP